MGIRTRIIKKGIPLKQVALNFRQRIELTKSQVRKLGIETRDKFRKIIKASKKRPGGKNTLENAIEVEYFVDGVSWGVGNINLLNKAAKYWRALNWGSTHIVGKKVPPGTFSSGNPRPDASSFRQGRWQPGASDNGQQYSFVSKKPIEGINFLERTISWFKYRINTITSKLGAK